MPRNAGAIPPMNPTKSARSRVRIPPGFNSSPAVSHLPVAVHWSTAHATALTSSSVIIGRFHACSVPRCLALCGAVNSDESHVARLNSVPVRLFSIGRRCLHNASMTNVLIRDLPEEIHQKLTERALAAGVSLQHYLTAELTRLVQAPTLDEVIDRIERMSGGTVGFEQAVADLEEVRGER